MSCHATGRELSASIHASLISAIKGVAPVFALQRNIPASDWSLFKRDCWRSQTDGCMFETTLRKSWSVSNSALGGCPLKIDRIEAIPVCIPLKAGLSTKTAHGV